MPFPIYKTCPFPVYETRPLTVMAHTEADETIVAVFAALKELSELRERYDSLVSEAYFNITRARHTMGRNAISQLQYPMKMESSVHVHATRECESWSELGKDDLQFLVDAPPTSTTTTTTSSGELRQRASKQATQASVQEVAKKKKAQLKVMAGNPIRWFSSLPPHCLRESQSQFSEAIEVAIAMATVQTRLEQLRRHFCSLNVYGKTEKTEEDKEKEDKEETEAVTAAENEKEKEKVKQEEDGEEEEGTTL